jgi:SAM-dependent methyltransferase
MKKDIVQKVISCLICNGNDFYPFLDLGNLPIPNGFLRKEDVTKREERYPLSVMLCTNCYLVQVQHLVNPDIMFRNYLYIPSASQTRMNHFRTLSSEAKERFHLDEHSLVVDIGSNDGSLLTCFKNLGISVVGIDPAENLVQVARLNGVETVPGYFTPTIARKVNKQYKKASIAFATNVFAHVGNLHEFMKALDILLDEKGVFISQFPYLLDLIEQNQFDTIYHEHLSYFSLEPLLKLAELTGFEIFDVEKKTLDGGSIRVYWKKKGNKDIVVKIEKIQQMLSDEKQKGLYSKKTYADFASRIKKLKTSVKKELLALRKQKKHIVGYGAAAKGNILLNYFLLGTDIFDYLVDSTPYKQGLFTPGTHIPIYDETRISETKPDYLVILAWNFTDEIIAKNKAHQKYGGKFLICVPAFSIIE